MSSLSKDRCTQTWLHVPIQGGGHDHVYQLYVSWHMGGGTLTWTTEPRGIRITQLDAHYYETSPLPLNEGNVVIRATDSSGCSEIEVPYPETCSTCLR